MSALIGFLADIAEHPDDDTPRLICADWMDDQGDSDRAEHIRLQCERARLPPHHPGREEIVLRESRLWERRKDEWKAPLRAWPLGLMVEFHRGFPDSIFLSTQAFLDEPEELFRVAPTLSRLTLWGLGGHLHALAECPQLSRLSGLTLLQSDAAVHELSLSGMQALLHSPHLGRLTHLGLRKIPLDQRRLGLLASSGLLGRLTSLSLWRCQLGAREASVLADSPKVSCLTELDLGGNAIGDTGTQAIAHSPHLAGLTNLNLEGDSEHESPTEGTGLRDDAIEKLAASPQLLNLALLSLSSNFISDRGASALASSQVLGSLVELDLRGNRIGDVGVQALAGSPHLSRLHWLGLSRNPCNPRVPVNDNMWKILALTAPSPSEESLETAQHRLGGRLRIG